MAKAMARAYTVDVRKGRTTLALLALAGAAWLLQAVAFVLGSPRGSPKVLTARGAAEEDVADVVGVLPTKMKDLRVGQELQGIITQVRERIALVDVGVEKVGLLPGSKLLDGRPPQNVADKLNEGDSITVYVSEVQNPEDPRNGKLVLSGHKNKILNPFQFGNRSNAADLKAVVEAQKSSEELVYYKGVVTAEKEIGVIVAFRVPEAPGITSGLVYKTEVQGAPKVMDHIKVRILDVEDQRVKLSMRDEAPLTGAAARFGDFRELVEKTCPGKVTGLVDFGAWVEVTSPSGSTQRALLPAGEIEDCFVEDPAEFLEVGQEFTVKILEITEKGIRVSKKQAVEAED